MQASSTAYLGRHASGGLSGGPTPHGSVLFDGVHSEGQVRLCPLSTTTTHAGGGGTTAADALESGGVDDGSGRVRSGLQQLGRSLLRRLYGRSPAGFEDGEGKGG